MGKRKGGAGSSRHSESFVTTVYNQANPDAAAAAAALRAAEQPVKEKLYRKEKRARQEQKEKEAGEVLDANTSRHILEQSRQLLQEEEIEAKREASRSGVSADATGSKVTFSAPLTKGKKAGRSGSSSATSLSVETAADFQDDDDWAAELREYEADASGLEAEITMSAAEQALVDQFARSATVTGESSSAGSSSRGINLGALIMQKIKEAKERSDAIAAGDINIDEELEASMDPELARVYRGVGKFLHSYRAGKLPRPFRFMMLQPNWEEILYLTEPENWSSHAMYAGTKIFISSLPAAKARDFLYLVILPRFCREIMEHKKLSFHMYRALRKATFKPAAFFKGLLFPLLTGEGDGVNGECTLRAAAIICSVINRASIPVLHGAAAMLRVALFEYSAASCFVLRCLLDKRYALPYQAIDAVYAHFIAFLNEERRMPKIWHQCLLVFAQRYREQLEREQKLALRQLLRRHVHRAITPEIRRELFYSICRGGEAAIGDEETGKPLGRRARANSSKSSSTFNDDENQEMDDIEFAPVKAVQEDVEICFLYDAPWGDAWKLYDDNYESFLSSYRN